MFNPPSLSNIGYGDKIVEALLGGFRRWDGIYMLHVAEYGYTYENSMAMFPLFPLLVRFGEFKL